MDTEKFIKTVNPIDENDTVFKASHPTVEEFKEFLEHLCEIGYKDCRLSCCGMTYFYTHLFKPSSTGFVVIDTDEDI